MKSILRHLLLLALMVAASGMAVAMRPTQKIADMGPPLQLETMIPKTFGEWREEPQNQAMIIDPQQLEMINRIYSQTLTRTYVNPQGYRVMLSIAYGSDQSEQTQLHKPEVCYPSQGFMLKNKRHEQLATPNGSIPVTRLETTLGQRHEPVTYWITVADKVVGPGLDKKLTEMQYGLRGQIPDGLLFRVSSIDTNVERAFKAQTEFVVQLLAASTENTRTKLTGSSQVKVNL